jgi:hypothetical protein
VGRGTPHKGDGHPGTVASLSSVFMQTYDALFVGNLTSSNVAALDELFLATNYRANRRALFSDAEGGPRSQLR